MAQIGFLVSSAPHSAPGARTLYHLANAALNAGHEVLAYCHQDGVYQLIRHQHMPESHEGSPSGWWQALVARGASVHISDLCARSRGVDSHELLLEGVHLGNPSELAQMLVRCSQVICL
jgi:sulfur relay (sulfurtransferase) complex TusBCD TusD component (DsrE family)